MPRLSFLACAVAAVLAFPTGANAGETMRLEWVIQGQFAGPLVALEKCYYKEAGVEMELMPAGPDIKPGVTVAQGTDSFGIGHPNQVISARANGAPLVTVAQFGHRSASVYVARKSTGITGIKDMKGHSVGLWFGGDEHEFLSMLNAAGIPQEDVKIVNQGFDIIAWLNGDYEVMQATIYNELQQVYRQGIKKDDLVFLDASESGVALVNTGIFTTEKVSAALHWPLSTPYFAPHGAGDLVFAAFTTAVAVMGFAALVHAQSRSSFRSAPVAGVLGSRPM